MEEEEEGGEFSGYTGRRGPRGCRMAHLEIFCGQGIRASLAQTHTLLHALPDCRDSGLLPWKDDNLLISD